MTNEVIDMQIVVMIAIVAAVWAALAPGKAPRKKSGVPSSMARIRKLEGLRNRGALVMKLGRGTNSVEVITRDSRKILDELIEQEKDGLINIFKGEEYND